jgi:deoxycytidine triphosphate deaminase
MLVREGSVLLSDDIKQLQLIVDDPFYNLGSTFDENHLDKAKYNARLGKAYFKDGKYDILSDDNPLLEIKPYELVFVESYEVFKLPQNVIGKYDIRISGCLGGLGLQTGLQLDPTYHGRFFCPLFNFSDTTLTLKYKDQLASVHFIYTTKPTIKTKPYTGKQNLFSLSQALSDTPRGSGLGKLWENLQEFDRAAARLHTRIDSMIGAVFEGMAFMIAALGIIIAGISMLIIPEFKVGAQVEMSLIIKIVIGIAIFLVVTLGVFGLMKRKMRQISEANKQ